MSWWARLYRALSAGMSLAASQPPQLYWKKSVQGSALLSSDEASRPTSASDTFAVFGPGGGAPPPVGGFLPDPPHAVARNVVSTVATTERRMRDSISVAHATTVASVLFPPHLWLRHHSCRGVRAGFLVGEASGSRLALRARMHKLTVLTLLSLSLTTACMSEASWPHRDRAGFPVSTWTHHESERDRACRSVARAAEVSPDSMSDRQQLVAARCGYSDERHWVRRERFTPPPPPPPVPTRPESARSAGGAHAGPQSIARR